MKRRTGIALAITLSLVSATVAAETAYVSSELAISLRKAADGNSPAIRGLKIGTPFTVLERGKDSEFTRVRLEDGTEGWVQTRHVSTEPSQQLQLTEAQTTIDKLRAELAQAESALQNSAANPAIEQENGELKARISELEESLAAATKPSLLPKDDATRHWFLAGAGVMLAGVVAGLLLPSLRRKRSSWGDL